MTYITAYVIDTVAYCTCQTDWFGLLTRFVQIIKTLGNLHPLCWYILGVLMHTITVIIDFHETTCLSKDQISYMWMVPICNTK